MIRSLYILCFIALHWGVSGQLEVEFDTLHYTSRMNSALDSIDISGAELPSAFDGGRGILSADGLSVQRLLSQYTQPTFMQGTGFEKIRFSALPYLGFSYTVGGQGSQFLRVRYVHAFSNNTLINLTYKRRSGSGILRNGEFVGNDVYLQFQHRGTRYSTRLNGFFVGNDLAHSNGLKDDSLVGLFDLEFLDVNRADAHSKSKTAGVDWANYLNVLRDSSVAFGPMIQFRYRIQNRVFTETGTLTDVYPAIFIDSFSTRDQYNLASYSNGAGIYFRNDSMYTDVHIDYRYWQYQNLGVYSDSTELDLRWAFRGKAWGFSFLNDLKYNLQGRYQEFDEHITIGYKKRWLRSTVQARYQQLAPTNFQRAYFSNSVSYPLLQTERTEILFLSAKASASMLSGKVDLGVKVDYAMVNKAYLFNGQNWSIDSSQNNLLTARLEGQLNLGLVYFQPQLILGFDERGYLPDGQLYARLFVKGKMFKARKLEALAGVDFSYISAFKNRAYLPVMDTYDWFTSASLFKPTANLHAFVSLGIAEFRFFVRYENMGSFWWDKKNTEMENYPLASRRLRIGLTWDFFN